MSFLGKIKPNKPVAGLEGYFVAILSASKFGKTTFVYDLINEYYNGDFSKAILLAPEIGYKTLDGIHALPITEYNKTSDEEKEENGNYGFIETVDDLIQNKKEHGYRLVIVDTITALERLATKYMLQLESRKKGKRLTDISDIAYGGGYTLLAELLYAQIERLKRAGFAVWCIGHEKTKTITLRDGSEYNKITLNCQGKTIDIIEREADMIIYGDLIKKVDENGNVSETRMLRFRSDGNIICGSRFRTMPDAIDLDVPLFIKTFKEAVLASFNGDEKAVEVAEKEQEAERESKSELYIEQEQNAKTVAEYIEEIGGLIGKMTEDQVTVLKKRFKDDIGTVNYKAYKEVDQFEKALSIANEILG